MRKCLPFIEAFTLASVAPALIWAPSGLGWFLAALVVAAAHALLLGVPLVWLFRARSWLNPGTSVAAGFLIGAIPCALLMGRATLMGGAASDIGWRELRDAVLFYGGSGALSGLVFGCYLWGREQLARRSER